MLVFVARFLIHGLQQWPRYAKVVLCSGQVKKQSKLPCLVDTKWYQIIIDCSEIFIETPKALSLQAATLSDYKQEYLVSVAPYYAITYISPVYGGIRQIYN